MDINQPRSPTTGANNRPLKNPADMNGKDEIEAANIAKRKRVGHQDPATLGSLKCVNWKQSEHDVSIVLEASTKLNANDLDPELTDTEVKVTLADGARWQCSFNQEIVPEATDVSLQGSRVTIKVKKKQPLHWSALEVGGKERKSSKVDPAIPTTTLTTTAAASPPPAAPVPAPSRAEKKETIKDVKKEALYKLTHVKHDWFEKGNEELVVHIYVKQINKESVSVKFEEKRLLASFSTCDTRFLSMHEGTSENTIFCWYVDVVDSLRVEKCIHKISNSFIEVHLFKKTPRRWCALEASQVKGSIAHKPASSMPGSAWHTASKGHNIKKTKGITTTHQSKVNFDEMVSNPPSLMSVNTVTGCSIQSGVPNSPNVSSASSSPSNSLNSTSSNSGNQATTNMAATTHATTHTGHSMTHSSHSTSHAGHTSPHASHTSPHGGHTSPRTGHSSSHTVHSTSHTGHSTNHGIHSTSHTGHSHVGHSVSHASPHTSPHIHAGSHAGSLSLSGPGSISGGSGVSTSNTVVSELKAADTKSRKNLSAGEASPPTTEKMNKVNKSKSATSKSNRPSSNGDSNKESTSQKPTCMVSPLHKNLADRPQLVNLGMTGLDNLGNTCFQNSVLQVLANTRELRDYFLDSRFQKDINIDNPLGMGGKLAVAFALLMKVLWSGKHHSYAPAKLKNLIAMKNSLFTGFAQHDAQEFMAFLLDGLHEDLNRVRNKPYTTTVESDGRPDELVAEEAWDVHRQRNDSFVVDLFQGQYRSKLVCPICQKVSITFDPFMIVPVPLPKKQRLLTVIFFSKDAYRKPVKYVLRLPKDGTVENLKEAISIKTGVNTRDLRVFETYKHMVQMFFGKGSSLANVSTSDKIYVCEVLSDRVAGEPVVELVILQRVLVPLQSAMRCTLCRRQCSADQKLKRCTRCYRTAYCDHACQKKDWSRHRSSCKSIPGPVGEPFMISLPESQATYSRIVQMVEAYSRHSVDVFAPPVTDEPPASPSDCSSPISMTTATSHDSDLDTTAIATSPSIPASVSSGSVLEGDRESLGESDSGIESAVTTTMSTASIPGRVSSPEKDTDTADDEQDKRSPTDLGVGGEALPMRYVLGRQHNSDFSRPPFYLTPVDKDGRALGDVTRLDDQGDEPLDLGSFYYLGMDWRNNERAQPYVLVQSKALDYTEDSSVQTATIDESNMTSLDDSLTLFTEPEVLSPEHAWYCPSCKEHREATKQLSIWRLPHTLIIQLKRFSFRNLLWRDKIDKLVDFPTRGLDMGKYYIGQRPSNEPPPIYDLYGVINHHGGILGGHYTAYGRCPDLANSKVSEVGWRLFDDSMVSNTSEKQVVTRGAYVLFYRRRGQLVSVPRPLSVDGGGMNTDKPAPRDILSADSAPDLLHHHSEMMHHDIVDSGPFGLSAGDMGPMSLDNRMMSLSYRSASPTSFIDMDAVD